MAKAQDPTDAFVVEFQALCERHGVHIHQLGPDTFVACKDDEDGSEDCAILVRSHEAWVRRYTG